MATTALKPKKKPTGTDGLRNVMAFPRIKEFYEALVDRMHMSLNRFFLEHEFTFFFMVLPRDHEIGTRIKVPRFQEVELIYGGIQKLRELLEKKEKEERIRALDPAWDFLEHYRAPSEVTAVSAGIYESFASGKFGIEDVSAGTMQGYFSDMLAVRDLSQYSNPVEISEYEILKHFNLIDNHCYLSVPLIQFGEFDGVVHIVLHQKDLNFFGKLEWDEAEGKEIFEVTNTKQIGNLIKQFSIEYEGLILDWDIVEGEKWKEKSLRSLIDNAVDRELYERLNQNRILQQLGYQEYYLRHKNYFYQRFDLSSEMPLMVLKQYRRTAIMSILIDSFAHNISAHSLTALEWHFKQRAELLKKLEDPKADHEAELKKLESLPLLANSKHLDNEIHPFLRFMLDKGAFWTGLTRESNFGGKISSLFSVLWFNFVNNPLYLGTIAFSEGIKMIRIRITVLETESSKASIFHHKRVKLDGEFATIDLSHVYQQNGERDEDTVSNYVTKGKEFEEIKKAMQEFRAFFPGGVVGQHAFFTILENEIRNVKHFGEAAIETMKKEGLTLNLSLEEDTYLDERNNTKYYKIGVWIRHKVPITEDLLKIRLDKLWGDIITKKTYRPLLGGIFQDKVCAGMLFNNEFSSVQELTSKRSKRFYPYIKVGCSPEGKIKKGEFIEEYEISARRFYKEGLNEESRAYFEAHFQPFDGYYKKFFHLWKGEEIYHAGDMDRVDNEWENLARFSFVYLPNKSPISHFQKLREKGIIRIIDRPANSLYEAYGCWLSSWLKDNYQNLITFSVKGQLASVLIYENGKAKYFPQDELPRLNKSGHAIKLVHGSGERDAALGVVRIRQHGIFRRYFCEGLSPEDATMTPTKAIELFEILNTNICIFDNRISNRIASSGTDVYETKLNCLILEEKKALWRTEQAKGFDRFHFLVVHLSFIESFQNADGEKYHEDNIQEFIENEVIKGWKVKKNFILVVTTGRGRTQWWENLNPIHRTPLNELPPVEESNTKPDAPLPYSSFVTFRPVESLIAAVENSLQMKDDLELKYRLVKVLFGS